MGKETIIKAKSGKLLLFVSAVSLFSSILGCGSQNSGFTSSVGSACAGNTCSTALVNNNPSVFISTQAANISKGVSYMPMLPFLPAANGTTNRIKGLAAAYTVFGQKTEITGTCNTGGAPVHRITYSVRDVNSVSILTDINGSTYSDTTNNPLNLYSRPVYCDNGRFTLILTPPNDPAVVTAVPLVGHNACPTPLSNYCNEKPLHYLSVSLWTGPDINNLTVAQSFETTFTSQY